MQFRKLVGLSAFALLFIETGPVVGQQASGVVRNDLYGDQLPERALARLGTYRYQLAGKCVTDAAYSPDGKTLAVIGLPSRVLPHPLPPSMVRFWDAVTGLDQGGFLCPCTQSILFAPDGKSVLTVIHPGTLAFWDRKGTKLFELTTPGQIGFITFSHDGKTLAVSEYVEAKAGGGITLFDLATKKQIGSLVGHTQTPAMAAFSPDGTQLVSLSYYQTGSESKKPVKGELMVWDLPKLRLLKKSRHDGRPADLSSDGKYAALAGPKDDVRLIDTRTGKTLWTVSQSAESLHFSPADDMLALGGSNRTLLLSAADGKQVGQIKGRIGEVLGFSPDGSLLISQPSWSAAWTREQIRVWDVRTGNLRTTLPTHGDTVDQVAFSPDGRSVASAAEDGSLRLWDAKTAQQRDVFEVGLDTHLPYLYSPGFTALTFSEDSKYVATAGWDQKIRLVNLTTRKQLLWDAEAVVANGGLAFSADGSYLIAATRNGAVQRWPIKGGLRSARYLFPWNDRFTIGPFSAHGHTLFMGAGQRWGSRVVYDTPTPERFWQGASGRPQAKVDCRRDVETGGTSLYAAAVSADGTLLATADRDFGGLGFSSNQSLRLWEAVSGKEILTFSTSDLAINCLAFSPDGRWLASGHGIGYRTNAVHTNDYQSHVLVWDVATGKQVAELRGHRAPVACLSFSPQGDRLASGSGDNTILIWDTSNLPRSDADPGVRLTERELVRLWHDLASDDAGQAYRAMCHLSSRPSEAISFLRTYLHPAEDVPRNRIKKAIAELHSDVFSARQRAMRNLEAWRSIAEEDLAAALGVAAALESRTRLENLLSRLRQPPRGAELQQIRGVIVLLRMNSPEARRLSQVLATGNPDAALTEQAHAALR